VLWVHAARRGNPGIWVLWLVIWQYRILEPSLGVIGVMLSFIYAFLLLRVCMREKGISWLLEGKLRCPF
jgi:hypothetical protein